ncbi:hypothetical protein [Clostridium thailandense]|uniref:hypothetical protein n=1 Tax=Clostridium thailandense TaxID=2794346 RepID=UPI003989B043
MIQSGTWIEVEKINHHSGSELTKIYIRGYCLRNCELGEETEVKTISGHVVKGIVSRDKSLYHNVHNLGKNAKEILMIRKFNS